MLVYDLGGGTFDATVIELADRRISVLAVEGDHQLGGADWDERIALHLSRRFCADNPDAEDPLDDSAGPGPRAGRRTGKHQLTDAERTEVLVTHDGARATVTLSRAELEEMTAPLLRRPSTSPAPASTRPPAAAWPRSTGCCWSAVRRGCPPSPSCCAASSTSTRSCTTPSSPSPAAPRSTGRRPSWNAWSRPTCVPAGGCATATPLDDALPADLDAACRRVADAFGVPLTQVRRAVEIRVDTVVSRGFGVLAVNAQLGRLEVSWLVHRNDRLPIRTSRSFGTVRADQPTIEVTVVEQQGQAESARAQDAKVLIAGEITGIPPGYGEGSEVRVTFEMGFDGVLHVTAFHVDAAIPLVLTATTGATLSQAEVARERDQLGKQRRRE